MDYYDYEHEIEFLEAEVKGALELAGKCEIGHWRKGTGTWVSAGFLETAHSIFTETEHMVNNIHKKMTSGSPEKKEYLQGVIDRIVDLNNKLSEDGIKLLIQSCKK